MRCPKKTSAVAGIFGLILALMVPLCALAQGNWQSGSIQGNNAYVRESGSLPPSHWPATEAQRPLETAPGAPSATTSSPHGTNVVQVNYEKSTPPPTSRQSPRLFNADPVTSQQPAEKQQSILPRRNQKHLPGRGSASQSDGHLPEGLGALWATGGALALVLGIFFIFAWIMRRAAPKTTQPLPSEVVEILGRVPLIGRQSMHLIRCGGKLLLVNVTNDSAKTLTEITDPVEVDRLADLCSQSRPSNTATAFRQVFEQFKHSNRLEDPVKDEISVGSLFHDSRAPLMEARDA